MHFKACESQNFISSYKNYIDGVGEFNLTWRLNSFSFSFQLLALVVNLILR